MDSDTNEVVQAVEDTAKGTMSFSGYSGWDTESQFVRMYVEFNAYASSVHARYLAAPAKLRTLKYDRAFGGVFTVTIGGGGIYFEYSCGVDSDKNVFDFDKPVLQNAFHEVTGINTGYNYPDWVRSSELRDYKTLEHARKGLGVMVRHVLGTLHGYSFVEPGKREYIWCDCSNE